MGDDLTIWRAIVATDEDRGKLFKCDVIEHEGDKWLVPYWLHSSTEEWSMPARIVRLSAFRHQWHPGGKVSDATVNEPVPKSLLDHTVELTAADADRAQNLPDIKRTVRRRLN
ncbi:MAG: hypothetical protein U1E03_11510 [Hyphomonadaceae bacterium]